MAVVDAVTIGTKLDCQSNFISPQETDDQAMNGEKRVPLRKAHACLFSGATDL